MSGIELAGLILGAFPLAVSAMEHFQDTRKAAKTFWKIRKAHRKDVRNVKHCQTMFVLHVEELLQPLTNVEINGDESTCSKLLEDPGGELWRTEWAEQALSDRLRNHYESYRDMLEELQLHMVKLIKETRAQDVQFSQLLSRDSNSAAQRQLMQRANAMMQAADFQAKRLKYSMTIKSRNGLLQEVEKYIRRLQDLLAAVDRVSNTSKECNVRISPINKAALNFWKHAARIYRLLNRSMRCNCRSLHSARLWLQNHSEPRASLGLLMQYAHSQDQRVHVLPWQQEALRIQHVNDCAVSSSAALSRNNASRTDPRISADSAASFQTSHTSLSKKSRVSFATHVTSSASTPDLSLEGLCETLSDYSRDKVCIGALVDEQDDVLYQVCRDHEGRPNQLDTVTASTLLRNRGSFQRAYRYDVAVKIATAHIRFHTTEWLQRLWSLEEIGFLYRAGQTGTVDYSTPYILTNFSSTTLENPPSLQTRDLSFTTLGMALLELCFGMPLEDHPLFDDLACSRNPQDPFQRLAVAHEWSQDVELEAGGDYARAVKWCLQHSPLSGAEVDWRDDFAQNVLQPLQRCCKAMQGSMK